MPNYILQMVSHQLQYIIRYKDTCIAFYLSKVGAPACVVGFEEIVAMGAKKFVLFGSCVYVQLCIDNACIF